MLVRADANNRAPHALTIARQELRAICLQEVCLRLTRRSLVHSGTFDNFNEVVAGLKGTIAAGAGMISDTLLVPALDEVSTEYGLLAEAVSHPPDFSSASFRLRPGARFHDGKPVTVEDVIYSFEM